MSIEGCDQAIHGGTEDTFRDTERALREKIERLTRQVKSQSLRIKYLCEAIRRITRTAQGVNLNG